MPVRRLGAPHGAHPALKNMLKSALEDFESNSLSAVPGLFAKLRYVAALHGGHGAYSHWGLALGYTGGKQRNAPSGRPTRPCWRKC
jgi:hypothetical protein